MDEEDARKILHDKLELRQEEPFETLLPPEEALARLHEKTGVDFALKIAEALFHGQFKDNWAWGPRRGVEVIKEVLSWNETPPKRMLHEFCVWIMMYYENLEDEASKYQQELLSGNEDAYRQVAYRLELLIDSCTDD